MTIKCGSVSSNSALLTINNYEPINIHYGLSLEIVHVLSPCAILWVKPKAVETEYRCSIVRFVPEAGAVIMKIGNKTTVITKERITIDKEWSYRKHKVFLKEVI